jgi:hypothetical protein
LLLFDCVCPEFIVLLFALILFCGLLELFGRIAAGLSELLCSGPANAGLFPSSTPLLLFSETNPPFERRRLMAALFDTICERDCVCDCICDFVDDDDDVADVDVLPGSSVIILHWKGKRWGLVKFIRGTTHLVECYSRLLIALLCNDVTKGTGVTVNYDTIP